MEQSLLGLNVDVFQKVPDTPSPFVGNIIEDFGSRLKVKYLNKKGQELSAVVNRGACSSEPWKKRRKKIEN